MKNLKKLASVALALVMAMALMVPAFAAGDGTITIKNATIGEDYSIYKIFSATYSGENAAYSIKSTDPWYNLVNADDSPFTLTQIGNSGEYNVAVKAGGDVIKWLNGIENLPAATATQNKVQAVEVKFTGVDFGYYLVKSSLNGGGVLTVDNATPDATVIDKNQRPGSGPNDGKEVTSIDGVTLNANSDKSAEIGDEMEFQITYTATNYIEDKQITNYKIEDDMPDGFTLTANSIEVKVGTQTLSTGDYTVTYGTNDTDDFTVDIPWVDNSNASKYDSPVEIVVTYKATMNANAAIDGNGNTNTAKITYTDIDGNTHNDPITDTKTETVYTYALAIKKVNKDGDPLAGATFTLTDEDGNTVTMSNVTGGYQVDKNGTVTAVVSGNDGLIIIKGVKNQEYSLTETAAPTGYNVLTAPEKVTPVKTGETSTTVTKYLDANGNEVGTPTSETVDVNINANVGATAMLVVNFTGAQLPATGGMGTTIFYAVGGVLLAGSAILFITKKRMGE